MIEKTVLNYLLDALDVPVYLEIPENAPESFVVLEKTGSGRTNHVLTATIAARSYGARLEDAALLNERVKAAIDDIIALKNIGSVSLNSDYNFTNATTREHRYQCVYVITYTE